MWECCTLGVLPDSTMPVNSPVEFLRGSEVIAITFDAYDIQDEYLRNTLKTIFEDEFEKFKGGVMDAQELNNLIAEAYSRDLQNPELVSFKEVSRWGRKFGFPIICTLADESKEMQIHWAASLLIQVAGTWPQENMPELLKPERGSALFNDAEQLLANGLACFNESLGGKPSRWHSPIRNAGRIFAWWAILAFIFIGIASAMNRVYWVNSKGLSQGAMSSTWVKEKFGLDLGEMCRYDKPQHIEFKVLPDQTIQFRCSWFEGGGVTLWPFYTEHDVKSAEATSVLNGILQGTEERDE